MEGRFDHNVSAVGAQHKVVKLKGRSLQVLARLVADAANVYDVRGKGPVRLLPLVWLQRVLMLLGETQVVYIDGSHAARDVIADAVLAWALLRPGGILIFDGDSAEELRYWHLSLLALADTLFALGRLPV